ncbi:ribbon-helix-helix domain-containing protein [Niveispirillum sp. KHB5.9]|uniref:ribbon-helix-helix domain-containing protein n=1 Tax=Niveispirillum sp. KHB5.9 TaxID=3400269 RepID=UPI003A887A7D
MPPRSKRFSAEELPDGSSTLVIRNVVVLGKRTSLRMEPEMWDALADVAGREGQNVHDICTRIVERKPGAASLTAAIRVFLVNYYRLASTEEGHARAGHGRGDIDIIAAALALQPGAASPPL